MSALIFTNPSLNTSSLVFGADIIALSSRMNTDSCALGIVDELKQLENGRIFQLRSSNDENMKEAFVKVFLVCACCDKPAQCLVQCLLEPIARFGCGRCEIKDIQAQVS